MSTALGNGKSKIEYIQYDHVILSATALIAITVIATGTFISAFSAVALSSKSTPQKYIYAYWIYLSGFLWIFMWIQSDFPSGHDFNLKFTDMYSRRPHQLPLQEHLKYWHQTAWEVWLAYK